MKQEQHQQKIKKKRKAWLIHVMEKNRKTN